MRSVVDFKVGILIVLFTQVTNKHLKTNGFMNLESLTEMPQNFGWTKCRHKKKN